jgi:hypothetical protein
MSTLKSINVIHPSSAVNNIVNDASGNVAVGGALTVGGVAAVAVAPGTSGNVLTSNGTAWTSTAPTSGGAPSAIGQIPFSTNGSTYTATQKITQGTAQASTSGTGIDFTGIPSWVKRVTVMFSGVSTTSSGGSAIQIQIGPSTLATSGYSSICTVSAASSVTGVNTTSFLVTQLQAAGTLIYGSAVLTNISGNTWIMAGQVYMTTNSSSVAATSAFTGQVALSGVLSRVYIFASGDTFDAGSINILYE